ncbi:T9SS type A sorting domain-containing protein [Winogradskyella maritima]|uniref:T9SS type A sorting domain-containing protein n=1 Tax=Winogradskyella maritima TaxID=1517766 RepID=A0ABV8AG47_9FLAO|nr:T9SS type A sorting domain-containing protein [Winogradskyella maritima]
MFKKITLVASLSMATFSFSQTVSTVNEGNFYDSIAQDSQGIIYCSDFPNGSVYKYDTSGNVTVFASGFTNPNGVAVNGQDEIFICDATANTVSKYAASGNLLTTYSTDINNPTGIKNIPGTTDMLIVEYNNNTLKQLASDGTVTTLFSGAPLNGPSGIAFVNGETFISNYNNRMIMKFEGGAMTMLTQLPATAPNANFLGFITASNSQLYATQLGEHKVYQIDPISGNGTVYGGSSLGNDDGDISTATFNFPNGILADATNDRIYVSDAGTSNLRIIDNAFLSTTDFDQSENNFEVFINKEKDTLNINANLFSDEKVSIKIFEVSGKEILSKDFNVENLVFSKAIDTNKISPGIYFILLSQNGSIMSKKVIL